MNCPICKGEVEKALHYDVWCPSCRMKGHRKECVSCGVEFAQLYLNADSCSSDHVCDERHIAARERGLKAAEGLANRDHETPKSLHRRLEDGFNLMQGRGE